MRLLGAILAGGASSRFGSDKALALLDGKPLIAHVADALRGQCDALVVCGREWGDTTSVPDRPAPGLGPLGGLCAALDYGRANGFDTVLAAPCDVPRLPADLAERLAPLRPAGFVDGLPVVGLWDCSLATALDAHLAASDDRSMFAWVRRSGAVALRIAPPLANVNKRTDLDDLPSAP